MFFADVLGRKDVDCFREMVHYIINEKWYSERHKRTLNRNEYSERHKRTLNRNEYSERHKRTLNRNELSLNLSLNECKCIIWKITGQL